MSLTGVESLPFLSRSTPRQRCHHKNLTDPLKLSDACCQNCVSWTATSAALPRSETERFYCIRPNEANLSQSIQWLTNLGRRRTRKVARRSHIDRCQRAGELT